MPLPISQQAIVAIWNRVPLLAGLHPYRGRDDFALNRWPQPLRSGKAAHVFRETTLVSRQIFCLEK
jgi:hypothetical protein